MVLAQFHQRDLLMLSIWLSLFPVPVQSENKAKHTTKNPYSVIEKTFPAMRKHQITTTCTTSNGYVKL